MRLLFLCTGNYYRSRFAEEYFNHLAKAQDLGWSADSAGLARDFSKFRNPGPISFLAVEELERRGVVPTRIERFPRHATEEDFSSFRRIVALSEAEHRPLMREHFPRWESAIHYWEVGDIGVQAAKEALESIAWLTSRLVENLAKGR